MGVLSVEFKHTKAIPHTNLGSSRQVFRNIRGNKRSYKFFVDVDGFLKYQWFNDSVWSSSITIFSAGAVTAFDVKVHDTGSLLDVYVVLMDLTNNNLTYVKGTIGDSADTITFSSSQNIKTSVGVVGFEYNSCGIARTANSELVVTWTEYAGGSSDLRIIGSDGVGATPTWSGETVLITGIADGGVFNVLLAVGIEAFSSTFGDRVFVYCGERAGTDGFALEVTDWIQGTGFSSVATDTFAEAIWKGVSASIDSNDKVHIAWINDANDVRHALYPTAGGLGTESVIDVVALTAPEFPEAVSLTIDHTNDEVWVFYKKHSETADFYYKKSDVVTISFGSERTITIAEDIDYLSTSQRDQDGRTIIVSSPELGEGTDLNYHQVTTVQKQISSNLRVKVLDNQILLASNLRVKVLDIQKILASNLRVKVLDNQIILASNLRVVVAFQIQIPSNLRIKVLDNQIQIPSNLRVKILDNQIIIPSNLRVVILDQEIIIPSNLRVKALGQQKIISSNLRVKVLDNQILLASNLRVKVLDNQIILASNLRVVVGVAVQIIIPSNLRVKVIDNQIQIPSNLRVKVLDNQILIPSNLRVLVTQQIQKTSNLRVKVTDNQIVIGSNLRVLVVIQRIIPTNLRVKAVIQKIIPSNLRIKVLDNQIQISSNLRVVITTQIQIPSNLRVKVLDNQIIISSNLRVKVLDNQIIISSNLRVIVVSQLIIPSNLRVKAIDQQIIQPSNLRVKTLDNQIIIPSNLRVRVIIQSQIIIPTNLRVVISNQKIIPSNLAVKVFGQQIIMPSNLRINIPPLFTITVDDSDVGCVRKLMAQAGREAIIVHQDDILPVFVELGSEYFMYTDFQDIMDVQHIRLVDDLDHSGTNFLEGSIIFDKEGKIEIGQTLPTGTDEVMITYATRDGLNDEVIQINVDMAKIYMTTELWEQEIDFSGSSVYSTMAKWTMCAIATYWSILAMNSSNAIQSGYNYRIAEFEIQTKLWGEGMIAETLLNKYWERAIKMLNALKLYTKDGSIPIYVIDRGNTRVPYHRDPNIFNTITSMETVTLKDSKSRFAIIMKIVG